MGFDIPLSRRVHGGQTVLAASPASFFLSLMLPRKGQPFPPEHRNCSHTFRGVLQFRLPSAPQRYNTLDFLGRVVCHETAGFFGFFRSKGNTIPSEHPRQRETPFPFEILLPTAMLSSMLDDFIDFGVCKLFCEKFLDLLTKSTQKLQPYGIIKIKGDRG